MISPFFPWKAQAPKRANIKNSRAEHFMASSASVVAGFLSQFVLVRALHPVNLF